MRNIKFFCLTLNPDHEDLIKKLSYTPVGLGNKKFSNNFLNDKSGDNISKKILIMVNILFIIGFGKII